MSSTLPDKRVFHAMDAGRGIAALVVVIYHVPLALRGDAFDSGGLAVDFFFALSGFVLAHVYNDQLVSGRMGLWKFMTARLVRLYPLYLLSLLTLLAILAVLSALSLPVPWSNTALLGKLPFAFVMLPSPTLDPQGYLYPFNIAAWSILLELAVNLVFAIFCKPLQNARVRWAILAVSGSLLGVQLILQGELGGSSWDLLPAGLLRVCFSFFLGMQIYACHTSRGEPHARLHPGWSLLALAVLLACLYPAESTWLNLAAIFVVFPVLLWVLSTTELPSGRLSTALRELGVMSYAVYMMHGPVLLAWMQFQPSLEAAGIPVVGTIVLMLATVVLVSWAADRCFDRPVRGLLQHRIAGHRRRRRAALT